MSAQLLLENNSQSKVNTDNEVSFKNSGMDVHYGLTLLQNCEFLPAKMREDQEAVSEVSKEIQREVSYPINS